jgi:hypothetical protein
MNRRPGRKEQVNAELRSFSRQQDSLHQLEERIAMFKASIEVATDIAHDLNVRREFVWEIIKGMTYNSIEELEIKVCKAIVGH